MSWGDTPKKYRKCSKCKSTKGFELRYTICGYGIIKMDFNHTTLDAEREQFDKLDGEATCLNCGHLIPTENLKTD